MCHHCCVAHSRCHHRCVARSRCNHCILRPQKAPCRCCVAQSRPTGPLSPHHEAFRARSAQVYIYDASGNYLSQLPLYCLDESAAQTSIIGIDWYDGAEGVQDASQPTLAIGVENGRLQLMRHEHDDAPVLIDTGASPTARAPPHEPHRASRTARAHHRAVCPPSPPRHSP